LDDRGAAAREIVEARFNLIVSSWTSWRCSSGGSRKQPG
jgi:hypothetical protein